MLHQRSCAAAGLAFLLLVPAVASVWLLLAGWTGWLRRNAMRAPGELRSRFRILHVPVLYVDLARAVL